MQVNQEEVDALNRIYGFLESEVQKTGSDARGIYEKSHPDAEKRMLRRFTRYCYYELRAKEETNIPILLNQKLKQEAYWDRCRMISNAEELRRTGDTRVELGDTSLSNWFNAQSKLVNKICYHYPTPIEVVK
jgi:hypothetical protein